MADIRIPGIDKPLRIGKIIGIGRNYAKHAAEMNSPVPKTPLLFFKPSTAVVGDGAEVVIPPATRDVHHEIELVVAIGKVARGVDAAEALDFVAGYAVGLDMTARDLQAKAKAAGTPWALAKGLDTFGPLGEFRSAGDVGDPQALSLELKVNGTLRQEGRTADMIFSVQDLIAYCSSLFTLEAGDLIYTGTPSGVGPVKAGDELQAQISGLQTLNVSVRNQAG